MSDPETCFVVSFQDAREGRVVSLRVRTIEDSVLGPAFVCLSDFVFQDGGTLIDPVEEAMSRRYGKTRRLHLQLWSISSIEEVGMGHGGLTSTHDRSNLVVFPPPRTDA